jgi:hypothetical protein
LFELPSCPGVVRQLPDEAGFFLLLLCSPFDIKGRHAFVKKTTAVQAAVGFYEKVDKKEFLCE